MGLFDATIRELRKFIDERQGSDCCALKDVDPFKNWPESRNGNVVLSGDMAVELGSPQHGSVAGLLWTEESNLVKNGQITLIGPDIARCNGKSIPFGKIVLASVKGFDRENTYDRYREMENLRYDINLKGYMMRGVSQYRREWSRVSHEAVNQGFSLGILGNELIRKFRALDYVHGAEVIFLTSGSEDIMKLASLSENAMTIIQAMNKMAEEMNFDCDTCDFADVCDDVAELRQMRSALNETKGHSI